MTQQHNKQLAGYSEDYMSGRLSRRQFMKYCAMSGLALSSSLSAGCGASTKQVTATDLLTDSSALVQGSEQNRFLRTVGREYAGTTIRITTEMTPPSQAIIQLAAQEFTPLTGIDLDWDLLSLDKVLATSLADTGRQAGNRDVYYWDQAWIGRFVHDAVPPEEMMSKTHLTYPDYNFADFLQPLVDNVATYNGSLIGIPYDIPIFVMMYRRDILESLGIAVPTTYAAYLAAARAITESMGPRVYGSTAEWKSGHYSLTCDMASYVWAHGGAIFDADGRSTINDPQAHAAMEYMLELGTYMSPKVTSYDWFGEAQEYAQGRAAMHMLSSEFLPGYDDPSVSQVVGLTEIAPMPRPLALRPQESCGFGEVPGVSRQGGSCLALSRYSTKKDAAWLFLQWATSSDVTTRASLMGGGASPVRHSNYSDSRVAERNKVCVGTTRHFAATKDAIMNDMGTEPHMPAWASLSVDSFASELGKMMTKQQSVTTSLNNMAAAADIAAQRT